jgi:16S rRNA (guanine527-N7)-methyltransferase
MNLNRIAELLEPFLGSTGERRLTEVELAKISAYIDLLLRWNARVNLTAIRDPEDIVTRHFGESFFAARHLFSDEARSVDASKARDNLLPGVDRINLADIGSGAGFPGLPAKLWVPEISLTLIESNQKKAVFLREVCRALELGDVKIENLRAETIAHGAFDCVTLRAVERFSEVLPAAANLVRRSGRLGLLTSAAKFETLKSALPEFHWNSPVSIPMSESRLLLIGTKESKYEIGGK